MPPPSIAILGPGKFAYSLTASLVKRGLRPLCVYARSSASAKAFKKKFNIPIACDKVSDIPESVTHIFITVSDKAIPEVVDALLKTKINFKNKYIWHFSGSETSHILNELRTRKARTGSFHILQTFPDLSAKKISGCPAALESSSKNSYTEMKRISELLRLKPFVIKAEKKSLYHLAGVMISNFTVANFAAAEELFNRCNIKGLDFQSLAMPIVTTTLENISMLGTVNALSGPVERADYSVVSTHLGALTEESNKLEHLTNVYFELSKYLIKVASSKNKGRDYKEMESILMLMQKKYREHGKLF